MSDWIYCEALRLRLNQSDSFTVLAFIFNAFAVAGGRREEGILKEEEGDRGVRRAEKRGGEQK